MLEGGFGVKIKYDCIKSIKLQSSYNFTNDS